MPAKKKTVPQHIVLSKTVLITTLIIITSAFYYCYIRGFIPHDEGWILNPAQRILQRDIPYRDFHYIYTPGLAYLMSFGFGLFGVSIYVSRMITMAFALLTVYILYKLSHNISKSSYAYIIPVFFYSIWLPMHINFAWPVVYAVWSGLLTCLLLYRAGKTNNPRLFFFAGLTTGLTCLFKQNFGVALIVNNIIFFLMSKQARTKKNILYHVLGTSTLPGIFAVYFGANGALIPFFNDMYYFFFIQFFTKHMATTPFIYPDVWYKMIVKTTFYLFPLLISIPAVVLAYKRNKQLLFLASFCGVYYLFGIRPTTDIVHYVPLLSLCGLPFLVIISSIKKLSVKISLSLLMVFLLFLGIYSAFIRNHYRWDTPLIYQNYVTPHPRLGILTDAKYHEIIPEVTSYIQKHTTINDYLFIYSFSPTFYVLTERRNPTKYILLPGSSILADVNIQKEIIHDLKTKHVKLLLADTTLDPKQFLLGKFIENNYTIAKKIHEYTIWRLKR